MDFDSDLPLKDLFQGFEESVSIRAVVPQKEVLEKLRKKYATFRD